MKCNQKCILRELCIKSGAAATWHQVYINIYLAVSGAQIRRKAAEEEEKEAAAAEEVVQIYLSILPTKIK